MATLSKRDSATHAYVGYCVGCGALTAAHVDYPDDARNVAKFVARLIRTGRRVDRVTIEEVRATLAFCACQKKKKVTAQLTLGVA